MRAKGRKRFGVFDAVAIAGAIGLAAWLAFGTGSDLPLDVRCMAFALSASGGVYGWFAVC